MPPLRGPGLVVSSSAMIIAWTVLPTLVSVSVETLSRVSFCGGAVSPAADTVMPGTPRATKGAWLPELVGTDRRRIWPATVGSSASILAFRRAAGDVSSHSHGGATLGAELQPSRPIPSGSRVATFRSANTAYRSSIS